MAATPFYEAWVAVTPEFTQFGRKVDKGFKDALEPAGKVGGDAAGKGMRRGVLDSVKGLAGPLAAAFGALGVGKLFADSISQASDLAEAGTAISEVFGSQDKAIREFAKAGATAFGENEISVLRAAQSFGIYGKAAGLAGGDLTSFSTDMVALGTDLASFFNTDTQTAIDAIGAGLRGESEPLRQFGVLLDDAALKARAMEMGIYSGTGALTQQQRVLAAQAEILAQTSTAQGDFARTSDGLANQQRILAASWSDLVTQMGSFFLPIATTIVTFINSNIIPAIQGFLGALQGDGGGFAGFISNLMGMRDALIRNVAEAFPEILTAVVSGMSSLISTVVDVLPGLVQSLVTTLVTLVPLLINGALQLFTALVNAIPLIVPQLVTAIVELLPVLLNALTTLIPALIQGAVNLFIAIVQAIPVIIPALITGIVELLPTLISTLIGLIPVLLDAAVQLFTALIEAIPVIIPALIDTLIEVGPQLVDAILGIIPQLFDAGAALIQGLIDGIGSMFGAIGNAVGGVMDFIGGFFPHSPAKRGPFSGSGWTDLQKSGGALYDQFVGGFNGDDPTMPSLGTSVRVPRPASLDELGATGVAAGRPGITVENHFANLDPVVAIRQMSDDLSFAVGGR